MSYQTEKINDVEIVDVSQQTLDADNSEDFAKAVSDLLQSANKVVFDLRDLRFIDSSGLGTILTCLRQLQENGGELKLCGMAQPVRAMFELVRMHRVIEIHTDRDGAVQSF